MLKIIILFNNNMLKLFFEVYWGILGYVGVYWGKKSRRS